MYVVEDSFTFVSVSARMYAVPKEAGALELQLQVVMSHRVGAGSQTWVLD